MPELSPARRNGSGVNSREPGTLLPAYFQASGAGFKENVFDKIVGVFDTIKDAFFNVGDNIINGIWDGISSGWDWLKEKVGDVAGSLFDKAKNVLGIKSPSRKFMYVGEMSGAGIAEGWDKELPEIESRMRKDISGLIGNIHTAVSAENARMGQGMGAADTGVYDLTRAVGMQTAGINSLASEYRRGSNTTRPVIFKIGERDFGRAVVDLGGTEEARIGLKLSQA